MSARLTDNRNDEISELANSINSLANDLKDDQLLRCKVEKKLRHQALHDDLTGLFNRKHANSTIAQLAEEPGIEHSLMFLDLNGFKEVNDRFGHAAGDSVLKHIAQRLLDNVPANATVARWGGDEFVVVLPSAGKSEATKLASVLHTTVFDQAIKSDKGQHMISCSIGLATSSVDRTLEQALSEADALMYEQKKRQRAQKTKNLIATQRVKRAINENRIEMRFQPIVRRSISDQVVAVGADTSLFVRNNAGGHAISEQHIHKVVSTSVKQDLDNCNLTLALTSLQRWNHAGIIDGNFRLAIRLSCETLNNPAFPAALEDKLNTLDVNPRQLQIETPAGVNITTSIMVEELQNIGVVLGVDVDHNDYRRVAQTLATHPTICIIGQPGTERAQESDRPCQTLHYQKNRCHGARPGLRQIFF